MVSPELFSHLIEQSGDPYELLRLLLKHLADVLAPGLETSGPIEQLDAAALLRLAFQVLALPPPPSDEPPLASGDRVEAIASLPTEEERELALLLDLPAWGEPEALIALVRRSEFHLATEPEAALAFARLALLAAAALPPTLEPSAHAAIALARSTLGYAQRVLGEPAEARAELTHALEHAALAADRGLLAYANAARAALAVFEHRDDLALRYVARAQAHLDPPPPGPGVPRALLQVGSVYLHVDRLDQALAALTASFDRLDPDADRGLLFLAINTRCHLLVDLSRADEATSLRRRYPALFAPPALRHFRDWLDGRLRIARHQLPRGFSQLRAARRRADSRGDRFSVGNISLDLAFGHLLDRRPDRAAREIDAGWPLLLRRDSPPELLTQLLELRRVLATSPAAADPAVLATLLRRFRWSGPRLSASNRDNYPIST